MIEEGFELEEHAANRERILETGNPYGSTERFNWQDKFDFTGDILFFGGCTQPIKQADLMEKTISLIGAENLQVISEEPCCGSYLYRTGYLQEYEALRDKLISKLNENNVKEIVTACAGCYSTLKHGLAEKLGDSVKVMHFIEKLNELLKNGDIKVKNTGKKITYHDPCHLGRLGEVFDAPREVIEQLGTLVEMPHNRFDSLCCGAGGGVRAGFPELASEMGQNRIEEAKGTDADLLVTVCPFCELQLDSIGGMEVKNLIDLVFENQIK
jgi:Fe-S oxidoreductase